MMFKKGSFEIGGTIYPVAIKVRYNLNYSLWDRQPLCQQGQSVTYAGIGNCLGHLKAGHQGYTKKVSRAGS